MSSISGLPPRPLRIVIPGGSGQLGQVLAQYFQERGHRVTVLTRGPYTAPWQTVHWDGETLGPWTEYLEGADVCIHLAGRSVNCRYDATNRAAIRHSRIHTTRLLGQAIAGLANPPWLWMNASTANVYRHAPGREMDEEHGELGGHERISRWRHAPESWDFSVSVAKDWEAEFFGIELPGIRKVALRSAMVFSPMPGTAFAILSNLVRLSLGGKQGNGRQFVSWIHELDFARAVEFLIAQPEIHGAVNLAAPCPIPNREFMQALREAWGVPNGFPAPWPILELAAFLMRTESELVLKSRRVFPGRLLDAGFWFEFPEWPAAAEDLVQRWRNRD